MTHLMLFAIVPDWVSNWLTPVWLFSVGVLCGLALLLVTWGLLWLLSCLPGLHSRLGRLVSEVPAAVREGVLFPLFVLAVVFSGFAVFGSIMVREPLELLSSLKRLPAAGRTTLSRTIEPTARDGDGLIIESDEQPIEVSFYGDEIQRLIFESNQDLTVSPEPLAAATSRWEVQVTAGEPLTWLRTERPVPAFEEHDLIEQLYAINYGSEAAELKLTLVTSPRAPQVSVIPITALGIYLLFLGYVLQRSFMPRLSAIALATYKSEVAQPLFLILLLIGFSFLWLFLLLPYNTFGEDIKVFKDSALTLTMVLCIIQAIWAASTSVADEIEGRTALTVLSKPVGRRSFIVGKFVGIGWTVGLMFVLLGLWMLILIAYKPIYDAREVSETEPTWQLCHYEMVQTVPGLVLAFMETLVLTALSVAISTRLPMLANFVICFSIYVLGHLTPLLVQTSSEQFEIVRFFAQFIATVFPNLDHFNIQAAVAAGVEVPMLYLGWSLLYCVIYSLIAMLLALAMFEDRDLA